MKKSPQRYPWQQWLFRKTAKVLVRGRDYTCQPHSMAQQVRNAAGRLGVSVSLRVRDGEITILTDRRAR